MLFTEQPLINIFKLQLFTDVAGCHMEIEVNLLNNQKLEASFGNFRIISDQMKSAGGDEEMPEPFDYFLASMPLCAAFYVRSFCNSRNISTKGIKIIQNNQKLQEKYKQKISISIELPNDFPDKYKKTIIRAAESCTVKKVIQAGVEFETTIL
jgi:ribosomal protein S12 methylthiotransferase accessory factor